MINDRIHQITYCFSLKYLYLPNYLKLIEKELFSRNE